VTLNTQVVFKILKLPFPAFLYQSTPTKCPTLINTSIKGASAACFGTSVLYSGRTEC